MSLLDKKNSLNQVGNRDAPPARPHPYKKVLGLARAGALLSVCPSFFVSSSISIVVRSFESPDGGFTINNFIQIFTTSDLLASYKNSLIISFVTATVGAVFGLLFAYAVTSGELPKPLRNFFLTFSGVASNFAGVPLAFAFIATIGNTGMITRAIGAIRGVDLAREGWSVYNLTGLSIVYLYFQFPLMVLVMVPALDGIRREWKEAAATLGATGWQFWRHVGSPS
jgi:putative spermidine/putrescine transport system permease protein